MGMAYEHCGRPGGVGRCVGATAPVRPQALFAPVAQLDRASASEAESQRFESSRAYHWAAIPNADLPVLKLTLDVRAPHRRRIAVALEVDCTDATRCRAGVVPTAAGDPAIPAPGEVDYEFFVPTWTPGSYLIREYARHFGPMRAQVAGAAAGITLTCSKVAKNRYRIRAPESAQRLRIEYEIYAHELTVRTADVTTEHAYWNHACLLLWPVGGRTLAAAVEVLAPDDWDCIGGRSIQRIGAGHFAFDAPDLDALVDAPVLVGRFARLQREIRGVSHVLALDGIGAARVDDALMNDVQRIVEVTADVFGCPLPYPQYSFLALFADTGYGGLEHADSTTLLSARTCLVRGKSYQEFLGLLAHELFHAWNVKRMRPAELWDYDYEIENLTPMLWLAEGFTAYYDDLVCRRAHVVSVADYLALIAKNMVSMWAGIGRLRQSLAEASYDAWIRHYRPDENTRNSTQNYYGNGALAALILDLTIRHRSDGRRSLDTAVAALYRETFGAGRGYRIDDVAHCLGDAAGTDMRPLLDSLTSGPLDPDFAELLTHFGVTIQRIEPDRPYLGFAFESGRTVVASVADLSPAFDSGLAPGDEILAIEGLRVTSDRWSDLLHSVAAIGTPLRLLTASRGLVRERTITPIATPHPAVCLVLATNIDPRQARLQRDWLGVDRDADAVAAGRAS